MVPTHAHHNNFFMYTGYQTILKKDFNEEHEKRRKIQLGILIAVSSVILFLFLGTNDYFIDDCAVSEKKLVRTAEVEGEFTERFEEAYKEHFTECRDHYSLEEQITFNKKLNEVINSQVATEDV